MTPLAFGAFAGRERVFVDLTHGALVFWRRDAWGQWVIDDVQVKP